MFKRIFIMMLALSVLTVSFGLALAVEGNGNYRKGKYLFRKSCRTCHADGGSAVNLEPATYDMAVWTEKFAPEAAAAYECKSEWDNLSEKEVNDIYTYLNKFGKDSPTPLQCK